MTPLFISGGISASRSSSANAATGSPSTVAGSTSRPARSGHPGHSAAGLWHEGWRGGASAQSKPPPAARRLCPRQPAHKPPGGRRSRDRQSPASAGTRSDTLRTRAYCPLPPMPAPLAPARLPGRRLRRAPAPRIGARRRRRPPAAPSRRSSRSAASSCAAAEGARPACAPALRRRRRGGTRGRRGGCGERATDWAASERPAPAARTSDVAVELLEAAERTQQLREAEPIGAGDDAVGLGGCDHHNRRRPPIGHPGLHSLQRSRHEALRRNSHTHVAVRRSRCVPIPWQDPGEGLLLAPRPAMGGNRAGVSNPVTAPLGTETY